ncbi:MAG TPA: BatD family protein [Polyangia bacterium]|nr:BatD family protein [Polyangia bacterium]
MTKARLAWIALALVALAAPAARAASSSFSASLDRAAVAPDQPFLYRVTLTTSQEQPEGFKPPDFRGLRVMGGPFTQSGMSMVMGGGGTKVENTITWSYQLTVPGGAKGPIAIGGAHVRVGGQDLTSNSVSVRIGAAAAAPQRGPSLFPRGLLDDDEPEVQEQQVSSSASAAFIRAVADKKRAYVGEQVTVTWYLYLAEPQNNFQPITQPKSDGFWSEDIPSTNPQGRLAFTDKDEGGQHYQVATVLQRALFPLAPGKLTVTPMEAEVARADFFGRPIRQRRLKSEPLAIEAVALPREGQPAHFQASNVGHFTLDVAVDRGAVAVGDAVTLTVTVRGTGNVRNVLLPPLPSLPGWKGYEPKTNVALEPGATVQGSKTVEWLLRPEQPGKTTVPALTFVSFDPAAQRYVETQSKPIELVVSGEPGQTTIGPPTAAGGPASGAGSVITAEIRPIRVRATPSHSAGASFLRGTGFKATLVTPPLAFVAFVFAGRMRDRLSRDERRTSRRRLRSIARRRLHAAAVHRDAGRAPAFYVEIERVLRETLSEKLRVPVGGLRLDELAALLGARGLAADDVARLRSALEACDEARFSPGGETTGKPALDAMLERAAALIDTIEKAPLASGGQA